MERGENTDQTVGLSNPVILSAPRTGSCRSEKCQKYLRLCEDSFHSVIVREIMYFRGESEQWIMLLILLKSLS